MASLSIYRNRPWSLINQLHNELNSVFDRVPGYGEDGGEVAEWMPAVDIREETDRFVLKADVPGVDPKDIDITMENGALTIRGQRTGDRLHPLSDHAVRGFRPAGGSLRRPEGVAGEEAGDRRIASHRGPACARGRFR
jgi:hypothetical protein